MGLLEDILDERVEVETILYRMEKQIRRRSTGDKVLDGWHASLDRGQVPPEFWGPDGPPKEMPKPPESD